MDTTRSSTSARGATRAAARGPAARIGSLADLHAGPVLDVALLGAHVVAGLSPALAARSEQDPRHPWHRVLDAARMVRAATTDPCRALALAARERAMTGELTSPTDPDEIALLHALRVHLVLRTASAAGATPDRRSAERYVREQRNAAVLLGAEPDDLPDNLDEVGQLLAEVRRTVEAVPAADRFPSTALTRHDPRAPEWAAASALVPALVPGWARAHVRATDAEVPAGTDLEQRLQRLHAAAVALRPR